ncbi:MAG: asparaginase [Actinomyces sp.]|uniref:asparaginase n=1 Tax=Actinomyces sp. TaxID=29317 RepID=UPI0026DD047F|nr:asparaginase [Actinomyces sp.]MDO4243111.1 asparaginase [Actinomyces sp.]
MRVHLTYAGGTIGMVDSPRGLVPGADLEGWLEGVLPGTGQQGSPLEVTVTSLDPLIDSSNATPESWQAIIDDLRARTEAQAFVVLHGTDTMAYTTAALSYALTDLDTPVVVTGSQLPLGVVGSDAVGNVVGALCAATSGRLRGVGLFFGQHLLAGNRATKTSSWAFEGFVSPCAPPLATAGAPWRWAAPEPLGTGWRAAAPYRRHDVVVLDLAPGITAARLSALLSPAPEAVVLRAFGTGNVPSAEPGLTEALSAVIEAGTAVVVASQCQQAQVLLGHYESGEALARLGAVDSGDMTLEATYAKIQFLLSQGLRGPDLAAAMGRSIAGELSPAAPA